MNFFMVLNNFYVRCFNMFIILVFDMVRDMLIILKKLEFVREKENEFFK